MDINTLASTIEQNFLKNGNTTLQIQSADAQKLLASSDIAGLITTYLNSTLTLTGLGAPTVGYTTVTYPGQISFLQQTFPATAIFYLVNSATDGTPELTLALTLPSGWTFSQTYPPLKNQIIDQLTFEQPSFVLDSYAPGDPNTFPQQGLNFSGTLESSSSPLLLPVNWLLGAELLLTGTLTNWSDPQNTAPTMTLKTSPAATSLTLGSVALSTWIEADSGYTSRTEAAHTPLLGAGDDGIIIELGEDGEIVAAAGAGAGGSILTTSVALKGSVGIGNSGVLALTMLLQNDPDLLTFSLDANQALSSLADLTGLSGGSALSNMIPSQYPLTQLLSLDEFTIVVAPALQQIVNMSFGIKLLASSGASALEASDPARVPARLSSFHPIMGEPRHLAPQDGDSPELALAADPTSPTWVIIPNFVSINDIFVRFLIIDPLHISTSNIYAMIGATFWLGEQYPITVSISLPDVTVNAYLLPGNTIPLTDAIQHFGFTPPEGFELNIVELQMTANPNYKTFDFSAAIQGDVTLISIGNVNLTLTAITVAIEWSQVGFGAQFIAYSNFADTVDFLIMAQKPQGDNSGWLFAAQITHPFSIGELIENVSGWKPPEFVYGMDITAFGLSYDTGNKNLVFDVGFKWLFDFVNVEIDLLFHLESSKAMDGSALYKGALRGDFDFLGMRLTFIYAFDQANKTTIYTLQLGQITATLANPDQQGDKVLQLNFGNTTFGDILVFLIKLVDPGASSKLSAPWDALNGISLQSLSLVVNFTKNYIEIDYNGTFDLTFIKITKIQIRYTRNYGSGQVQIMLQGSFLGQEFGQDNPLSWDALNGQPPAVPGAGTKLLDLQYVGVGQHVTLNTTDITTMAAAISALEKTLVPVTNTSKNPLDQVGGLQFDSTSNWLFGAKFVILDTFAISTVFLDPKLYGLLIQISGLSADIFQGLSFEILYRKISDTIGVFHIELKLPDAMRHLEFGEVSVTLPIIVIDIYTNGNFRLDFGFPISLQNFSNSFAIEVFPFVGYGGFYFALLNGATSTRVPQIDNGNFSPVIEFGFALSVGVGKTFTLGPLSAGASVTIIGMLQGAFAWFNPIEASTPKALYYWLQGTIAVIGQVYGTIDFVVIKATISLTVYASITLTIEAYQPIIIFMQAGVEVKVSIKILFITLHFSFSATISLTFAIGSASPTPWHLAQPAQRTLQMRNQISLHRPTGSYGLRSLPYMHYGLRVRRPQTFSTQPRPIAGVASDPPLKLLLTPVISQALPNDFLTPPSPATPVTCNLLLLIENAMPPDAQDAQECSVPVANAAEMPYNQLMMKLLRWAIQFIGKDSGDTVTDVDLEFIHEQLDKPEVIAQTFAYPNLTSFFTNFNVVFEIDLRPTSTPADGNDTLSASFFPMFPELKLVVGQQETLFWSTNPVNSDYVTALSTYFERLMVDYENSVEQDPNQTGSTLHQPKTLAADDTSPSSMAGYLLSAYFAMLTKAVVQNAQDYLRTYSYTVSDAANTSLQSIAAQFDSYEAEYIVQRGDTHTSIAGLFATHVETLLQANAGLSADVPLRPGTRLAVPVTVTPESIVTANQSKQGIFTSGSATPIQLSRVIYQIQANDTFAHIAQTLASPPSPTLDPLAIIQAKDTQGQYYNAANEGILLVGSSLSLPTLSYTGRQGDTQENVAQYFGVPASQVTQKDLQFTVSGVSHTITRALVLAYTLKQGDTLDSVITYFFTPPADQLSAYEQLLATWNPTINFSTATAGTQIKIPYSETLLHLARYYYPNAVSDDDRLAALAPSVVSQAILTPLATLVVNALSHTPQQQDSFSSVAHMFSLTLQELTEQIEGQKNLFPNGTQLTIPNVPAVEVDDLVTALSGSSALNSAAASTSRFLLQGLRLPYPAMTAPTYPLYSLTGQELPLPATAPAIALSFDVQHAAPWIQFAGGVSSLTVQFSPDEQAQITAFQTLTLEPQISWIGRLPLYNYQPLHFTIQHPLPWQAVKLPAVACFTNTGQAVSEPTIWPLPATLLDRIADAAGADLLYDVAISTYIDSASGLQTSPVKCYTWATTVDITVQQIAGASSDGAEMPNTYLLNGTDDVGKQLLFDILGYLNSPAGKNDSATLCLLYTPDPSSSNAKGLVSDQLDTANTFLLKTNLSTLSHSGSQQRSLTRPALSQAEAQSYAATIDQGAAFLTLVWEASVVKSGGFYFQYATSSKASLPSYLFTQSTEATLTLLILLTSQMQSSSAGMQPFNTVVVVGDNIDASQASVFVEPMTYQVKPGDTLQGIASSLASFGLDVSALALANQTILSLLKPGQQLQIDASTPYTIGYGDTFASIAQAHAPASVTSIAAASQGLDIFTPGALMQFSGTQTYIVQPGDMLSRIVQQLDVPGLDVPAFVQANQNNLELLQPGKSLNLNANQTYTIQAGDTLASIARANPPATVEGIAVASQGLAILTPGALAFYGAQQLEMHAAVPPGNVGFQLWRSYLNANADQQQLNLLFNLLGYSIVSNSYFNSSNEGLPAGPVREPGAQQPGANGDAPQIEDDGILYYKQVLAVYKSANAHYNAVPDTGGALPAPSGSPYAGIYASPGTPLSTVQINLDFHDLAGNLPNPNQPPALDPIPVGYTDDLIGPAQWPSVTRSFDFPTGRPQLQISTTFRSTKYLPGFGQSYDNSHQSARSHYETYTSLYYQLLEAAPGSPPLKLSLEQFAVTTSAGQVDASLATRQQIHLALLGFVSQISLFLSCAQNLVESFPPIPQGTQLGALANTYTVTVADIMTANKDVELLDQLFANPTTLNIPTYYAVSTGARLSDILTHVSISQLEDNAQLLLNAGTALNIPMQTYQVAPAPGYSLIQIADLLHTTVINLATQNSTKPLTGGSLTFTLGGYSLPVTSSDTLQSMADAFNKQDSSLNATPELVAVANQNVGPIFPSQSLGYNVYVIQQGDTLASLASGFAADLPTLINLNMGTVDLFPAGTAIYLSGDDLSYTLQAGDTFDVVASSHGISIAELAARNSSATLLAVNQSPTDQYLAIPNLVEFPSGQQPQFSFYLAQGGAETITDIIGKYTGWDLPGFVALNQSLPGLFVPAQLPNTQLTPQLNDTIVTLAQQLGQSPTAFVQAMQGQPNILRPGALILCPALTTPASGATLSKFVQSYNLESPLALAAANSALGGLLAPQTLSYTYTPPNSAPITKQFTIPQNAAFVTFVTVVAQFNALFNITTLTLDDIVGQNPDIALAANQPLIPPPAAAQLPPIAVTLLDSYAAPIFPLSVELQMLRDQNRVDPDFQNDTSVFFNSTPVAPSPFAGDNNPLSLKAFATNFESAFAGFKLGTGAAESTGGASRPQLWVVNFDPKRNGIQYGANGAQVQFFALRPLSNQLWNQAGVSVPTYTSGSKTPLQWTQTQNFQNVELDSWLSTLLGAIDMVLSPQYSIPAYQLGTNAQALLTDMLTYKQAIAQGLRGLVDFLLNDQSGDLASAQEALYQQALLSLASVYDTTVMFQVPFTVISPYTDPDTAPLLSGKPIALSYLQDGTITNDTLVTHPLQVGDTFVSIANQFGITVIELVMANKDLSNVFKPGSNVTVLVDGKPVGVPAADGDTLTKIAGKVYGTSTPTDAQVQDLAIALWSCDLTGGQGGCGYTLYTNPPAGTQPTTMQYLEVLPVASFTTSKLPLQNGSPAVTFLLSVRNPEQRRMAFFDLDYAISELEYNIQSLPAVSTAVGENYQESSWLTFVNPIDAVSFGQVQVPIPLRTFPTIPILSAQTADPTHADSGDLDQAKQWNYGFTLYHQSAAQDSMDLGVFFNRLDDDPPAPPSQAATAQLDNTALFATLAAFATVYAPIKNDLTLLLSDPTSANALSALQALHDLVARVSAAWQSSRSVAAMLGDDGGEIHWYQFDTIVDEQTPDLYQYLVLTDTEASPLWPQINQHTPSLQVGDEALYSYTQPISTPLDLPFAFTELDAIQRQNGWSGASVIRNQNLLGSSAPDEQTNPGFVYQTPLTLFYSKVTPSLLVDTLAPLSGTASDLATALADFFTELFTVGGALSSTTFHIKVVCRYGYSLMPPATDPAAIVQAFADDQSITTTIPLVLNPLSTFAPGTDTDPKSPSSFVALLAQAATAAAQASGIAAADGKTIVAGLYLFDVSVYSSLTPSAGSTDTVPSKPLLDIRNRYWLPPA